MSEMTQEKSMRVSMTLLMKAAVTAEAGTSFLCQKTIWNGS